MQNIQANDPTPSDDTLSDILYSLQSQRYEAGGKFTIGGPTGTYFIKSPYNTECEFSIISVSTNNSAASSFALSPANPSVLAPPTSTTTIPLGASALGSEGGNPLDGSMGFVSLSAPNNYNQFWTPLGRGSLIYLNVNTAANTSVYAIIAFRRSYAHRIPSGFNGVSPATHSRPYSRRNVRTLDGLSRQYSGYDAQYPQRQNGKETYEHNEIPWEQDPAGSLGHMRGQGRSGR